MKGFKRVFRYGVLSVKSELRSVNLYLVLFFSRFMIQRCVGGVSDYLAENKDRMHIFELYVHFLSSQRLQITYLLGIMAVSCGSLFYSNGAAYYLIRGNRRRWALGQVLYLLLVTAGYNLILLFLFFLSAGGHVTFTNQWSKASVLAEQFGGALIGLPNVGISHGVLQMSPLSAGLITFLLSVLVGMAAGMVMICFGMRNKGVFGAAILAIAWFADYLITGGSPLFWTARYLSPFGLSNISWLLYLNGNAAVRYAVVFFCILIAIEFCILFKSAEKVDFMKLE